MTEKRKNKHLGSSFDAYLVEEGLYEEATSVAWKRVLSWQVSEAMKKEGISKSEMAKRMNTSRSQLERLLDSDNPNVLLETVQKAAAAVGKRMTIVSERGSTVNANRTPHDPSGRCRPRLCENADNFGSVELPSSE